MRSPYEVLGVSPAASMDDIKCAYRDKARMYSDDQAKMDELNNAYDAIIMNNGNRNNNSTNNSNGNDTYYSTNASSEFGDIKATLDSGRIDDAEMLLDGIPYQRRSAEWYYLKGTIQHRRGWLESAVESFKRAHEMEPQNPEYDAAYKQLNRERKGNFNPNREEKSGCGDPCNICSTLLCADCCCECMGGDLIRCC